MIDPKTLKNFKAPYHCIYLLVKYTKFRDSGNEPSTNASWLTEFLVPDDTVFKKQIKNNV